MAYGSLFSSGELPKINGTEICAIYGRMETAYRKDQILEDAYNQKPDYYLLVTEEKYYKDGKFLQKRNIKTRELPPEIAQFFGEQNINGEKVYVTRMYIRTSCSGNGSFIDQTLDFSGGCGATSKTICYYRLKRWDNANKLAIFKGEELGEKIEAAFAKKSYTVKTLSEDFNVEYPTIWIRNENGLNYPDVKLPSWRWLYGESPYVRNAHDPKQIRVFSESLKAHIYLEEVEPKEGDTDLIQVQFKSEYKEELMGRKGDYFCNIVRWNDSKKEAPGQIVRFKVLKENKSPQGNTVQVAAMIGEKVQFKREEWKSGFYRLVRWVNV